MNGIGSNGRRFTIEESFRDTKDLQENGQPLLHVEDRAVRLRAVHERIGHLAAAPFAFPSSTYERY